jgi:hypothetical protein
MRRTVGFVSLALIVALTALALSGCDDTDSSGQTTPTASPSASVDRSDPESVLRAYFAAWEAGDWAGQASFMDEGYAGMEPEPMESLRIVSLEMRDQNSMVCHFDVVFDAIVESDGVSMQDGSYPWGYELTWDAVRESWLITNYGV